jgi:hypothetical protein
MNIVVWGVVLMLHAVGTSFGAFFALRFLLGMIMPGRGDIRMYEMILFDRDVRELRRSHSDCHDYDVLQKERTSMIAPSPSRSYSQRVQAKRISWFYVMAGVPFAKKECH